MIPTIIESLYGLKDRLLQEVTTTVHRINSRNAANYWESERCVDYVHTFLTRKRDVEKEDRPELHDWIARFDSHKQDAAIAFWYEIHRGVMESLRRLGGRLEAAGEAAGWREVVMRRERVD